MSDEIQGSSDSPGVDYHVVIVPDARLTGLSSEPVTVSIFEGRRLMMTKGPQRYLQIDDEYHPLFDEADPNALELDEDGYMGETLPPMIGTGYTSNEEIDEIDPLDEG